MQKYKSGLFCFSPPVMLATFILEIALAGYTLWRYKSDKTSRLVVALLVLLAVFQIAEYMICEAIGVDSLTWARVGYIAITLLPAVGIHLAYQIAQSKERPLLLPAYAIAGTFALFFAVIGQAVQSQACLGNYVIFDMAPGSGWLYAVYYYGFVVGAMLVSAVLAKSVDSKHRRALTLLVIGYGAFLIPTTTINLFDPSTIQGIPSIMCGFAVIFAIILTIWIMPIVGKKR